MAELITSPMPSNPLFQNITGKQFGEWTVLSYAGKYCWNCKCSCGIIKQVARCNLGRNRSNRCEQCRRNKGGGGPALRAKDGRHEYPNEFRSWRAMRRRCKDDPFYVNRGITVCNRWQKSFTAFLEDMGPKPSPDHSIDRFPDTWGNYEPGNCRWATDTEQANNKTNSVFVTANGQTKTLIDWSRTTGVNGRTLKRMVSRGVPPEKAILVPKRKMTERFLTMNGRTLPVREWSKITGLSYSLIVHRIDRRYSVEHLFDPPHPRKPVNDSTKIHSTQTKPLVQHMKTALDWVNSPTPRSPFPPLL